jgi:hypothetical protein
MGLFDTVASIASLKSAANGTTCFPSHLKDTLLSCANFEGLAQETISWLNILIEDYNKCINTPKTENKETDDRQADVIDELMYNIIAGCLQFIPLHSQSYALVNMCILADDDQNKEFYDTCFAASLDAANEGIDKMLKLASHCEIMLNDEVLSSLGFLNFRANRYIEAQKYLAKSVEILSEKVSDYTANNAQVLRFVASKIHLASCFEYGSSGTENSIITDNTANEENYSNKIKALSAAIEQLLGCGASQLENTITEKYKYISNWVFQQYQRPLSDCTQKDIDKFIRNIAIPDCLTLEILSMNDNDYTRKLQNEYIHVLAHCISEYAVAVREKERYDTDIAKYPLCSVLHIISRLLLDWLVVQGNLKYVTCQATVRAENDATPEAIDLLLKHITSNGANTESVECSDEEAELQFFVYYLSEQELRLAYDNDELVEVFHEYRIKFLEYAEKQLQSDGRKDYDALFHYYIVYFRFLLKQEANKIISNPSDKTSTDDNEINTVYERLVDSESGISKHVLQPVRNEFLRLKKLYTLYRQIKNLNNNTTLLTKFESNEFILLLQFNGEAVNSDTAYADVMIRIYQEIVSRRNILLLAPVRNAPSCSFSVENIDNLLSIEQAPLSDSQIDCKKFIEREKCEVGYLRVDDKLFLSLKDSVKDKFKWALYLKSNDLFLLYSDFLPKNNRMFPIILGREERDRLDNIIKTLFGNSHNSDLCAKPLDKCSSAKIQMCYSSKFNIFDNKICSSIMQLLEFLEFDLLKYNPSTNTYKSRIDKDDIVVLYHF